MLVEPHTETEDEYLTIQEIKCLIQQLQEAEILKLIQIANVYTRKNNCLTDADELLNDAIVVIASGKRKFPRNVPLIIFFAGTMKSIAYNQKRKAIKKVLPIDDNPANDPILTQVDVSIDIESEAIAAQEISIFYDLVKSDDDVTLLIMAKCDGLSPAEICETTSWNRTQYSSVQKKLRRFLNKNYPNGIGK